MIEEKEELQGQLIASGQIVGSIVGCKGEKGEKGDPGEPGSPGSPGTPGQDGFSPIANISKTGKIATITITDSQGTTTAEIRDGEDGLGSGDMLKTTYDTNDNGIVDNAEKVNNHTVLSNVPANAVFTDTTYTAGTNVSISAQNVISATDTTYTAGTGIEITAGNVINNTQTSAEWGNISGDIDDQTDLQNILDDKVDSSDLSTVATSGSYNDLSNKPTIPTKVSDLTNDSGFINKNVNDLTNYTTTSVINTLLAGKENDIPIQNTAPQSPEENDLWIDTSETSGGVNILDTIFPVGSIVIKADNEDYSSWLGFTWERTLVGRVAVGIDSNDTDFDTIDETGGEKTHTLSINEMPIHSHTEHPEVYINAGGSNNKYLGYGGGTYINTVSQGGRGAYNTGDTGGNQAHNNLQPYQVVAYWKRTA